MSDKKYVWRLPPCPAHDVEGTESWLSDMAKRGYMLSGDGFFLGFGIFEKTPPRDVRFRLEAAKRRAGLLDNEDGSPDAEARELGESLGWRYVALRGDFQIYCSEEPAAPELNTDPQVQALALRRLLRSERISAIMSLAWLALAAWLFFWRGSIVLMFLEKGFWRVLVCAVIIVWGFIDSLLRLRYLQRLKKRLSDGVEPEHGKNWRRGALRYRVQYAAFIVLSAAFIATQLAGLLHQEERISLDDYSAPLPFAGMQALAGGGGYVRDELGDYTNYVSRRSDAFTRDAVDYAESATLTLPDGRTIRGGLSIEYYEVPSAFLARDAARGMYSEARGGRRYEAVPLMLDGWPEENIRFYTDIFPTAIIRCGRKLMRVSFYQTSEDILPPETWVRIMAESIREG